MLHMTSHQKMQIKTTVRYHYTPIRMAQNWNTKCWGGCGAKELSFITRKNAKCYSHFGRHIGNFRYNKIYSHHMIQKMHSLVYIQRTGNIHPNKNLNRSVAKTWKQRTCHWVGKWTNKWIHPDNVILCSTKM